MMANSTTPYRRTGTNSWKELLDQVNDELRDPPSGCSPIEEIELPDECHRWAVADIEEVHDKLNEMPGECFTFTPLGDCELWRVSLISEIEDQLSESWCDCGQEQCCQPCATYIEETEERFLGSASGVGVACQEGNCPQAPDGGGHPGGVAGFCNEMFQDPKSPGSQYNDGINAQCEYCDAKVKAEELAEEIEDLERQLASLRDDLAECPAGSEGTVCRTQINQQIEDLEEEIDEKEAEKADEEATAATKLSEANDNLSEGESRGKELGECFRDQWGDCGGFGQNILDAALEQTVEATDAAKDCSNHRDGYGSGSCCGCKWSQCNPRRFTIVTRFNDGVQDRQVTHFGGVFSNDGKLIFGGSPAGVACQGSPLCLCCDVPRDPPNACSECSCAGTPPTEIEWYMLINHAAGGGDPIDCEDGGAPCDGEAPESGGGF
jgi:hypothetical protein